MTNQHFHFPLTYKILPSVFYSVILSSVTKIYYRSKSLRYEKGKNILLACHSEYNTVENHAYFIQLIQDHSKNDQIII